MFTRKKVDREPSQWEVIATSRTVDPEDQRTTILLKDQYGELEKLVMPGYIETPIEGLFDYMEGVGQKTFSLTYKNQKYIVIKQEEDVMASLVGLPVKPPSPGAKPVKDVEKP